MASGSRAGGGASLGLMASCEEVRAEDAIHPVCRRAGPLPALRRPVRLAEDSVPPSTTAAELSESESPERPWCGQDVVVRKMATKRHGSYGNFQVWFLTDRECGGRQHRCPGSSRETECAREPTGDALARRSPMLFVNGDRRAARFSRYAHSWRSGGGAIVRLTTVLVCNPAICATLRGLAGPHCNKPSSISTYVAIP